MFWQSAGRGGRAGGTAVVLRQSCALNRAAPWARLGFQANRLAERVQETPRTDKDPPVAFVCSSGQRAVPCARCSIDSFLVQRSVLRHGQTSKTRRTGRALGCYTGPAQTMGRGTSNLRPVCAPWPRRCLGRNPEIRGNSAESSLCSQRGAQNSCRSSHNVALKSQKWVM